MVLYPVSPGFHPGLLVGVTPVAQEAPGGSRGTPDVNTNPSPMHLRAGEGFAGAGNLSHRPPDLFERRLGPAYSWVKRATNSPPPAPSRSAPPNRTRAASPTARHARRPTASSRRSPAAAGRERPHRSRVRPKPRAGNFARRRPRARRDRATPPGPRPRRDRARRSVCRGPCRRATRSDRECAVRSDAAPRRHFRRACARRSARRARA